jgi:tRNA/rRNA methyltransferase
MVGAGTNRTQVSAQGGPAIILVRPQLAVNIGTTARAMANFGLSDLRLVAPKAGWPPEDPYRDVAEAAASGATDVLWGARVFPRVEEAVADLHYVWATTARERGQGKAIRLPADAMGDSAAASVARGEKHGILFGPERTGLDNDEVALADAIVTFPVSPSHGSLNLAQAVLLMAYEWRQAESRPLVPFEAGQKSPRAERAVVLSFFEYLEAALTEAGYFRPDNKQPVMRRNLRNIFHRMELSDQDVRTLRGAVVRLVRGPRRVVEAGTPPKAPDDDPAGP